MNKQKRGVSLVVLVITIIVMVILAGTVVINLGETNIINRAKDTVNKVNLSQIQTLASTLWVDAYLNKNDADMFSTIVRGLKENDIDITNYNIEVTDEGVEVTPFDKTAWEHAYTYDQETNVWSEKIFVTDNPNVTGDIVVKFYKTGRKITPNRLLFQNFDFTWPEGDEYKILIEGSGFMGNVMEMVDGQITDGHAWQYDTMLTMLGYTDNCTIPYVNELIIEDGIENVATHTAIGATGLEKVIIPEGVKTIGASSFQVNDRLTQIYLPDSIETIEDFAFSACRNLQSIKLPANLKTIGVQSFYICENLTTVEIPAGITKIANRTFRGCTNLSKIIYEGTIEQWQAITFGTNWNDDTGEYIVYCRDGMLSKSGDVITI